MSRVTSPLPMNDVQDLNEAPHVLPQLIDMILGEQQVLPAQQKQLWTHLAECVHCQAFLGSYLLAVIESNKEHDEPEDQARELLNRLTQMIHETLREDIPAYIQRLEEQDEKEANRSFPQFAEHLQVCQDCQEAVRALRLWIRQSGV